MAKDAVKTLLDLSKKLPFEVAKALYAEGEFEKTESMKRTPVKYGILKGTHEVEKPVIKRKEISVRIVVGGPAAPYAVPVHENMEAFHPIGQAKFLESVINESRPFMAERVAQRLNLRGLV